MDGTWTLEITDYVNNGETNPSTQDVGVVNGWSMHFTGLISTTGFGAKANDTPTGGTGANGDGEPFYNTTAQRLADKTRSLNATVNTNTLPSSPTATAAAGTGPGIVAAVDNTLGAFSPFQGRIYLAYASGAAVNVIYSDNDGTSWSAAVQVNDDSVADNFSQGSRPMMEPAIAVDPVTGSVVIEYYDARYDPDQVRYVNSIAVSVDGGAEWSASAQMNSLQTATDAITGDTVDVTPIPGNSTTGGAPSDFGLGDREGLVVYDGDVVPFFGSNLNASGMTVMTADVTIPSGPTVVSGDEGPIASDFTYTPTVYASSTYTGTAYVTGATYAPITYNNTFASDGTREFSQFVVAFDRPVNISTFQPDDIQVSYQSPYLATGDTTAVAVGSITPLDLTTLFGPAQVGLMGTVAQLATQFLITLMTPQTLVGTYSYAIGLDTGAVIDGPLVSDRIRSVPTGLAEQHTGPTGTTTVSGTPSTTVLLGTDVNQDQSQILDVAQVKGANELTSAGTFTSTTSPTVTAGGATTTSNVLDPGLYQQITQDYYDPIQVEVNLALASNTAEDLTVVLMSPDGTKISFGSAAFAPTNDLATVVFADFNPYDATDVVTPATALGTQMLLSALVHENAFADSGNPWQLQITNNNGSGSETVTLNSWSLILPLTTDEFAVPNPTNGVPFQFPYSNQTQPLLIPGPHVVSTAVVSAGTYNTISTYNQWTLASGIGTSATSITVNSGGPTPPTTPFLIQIDNEELVVTNTDVGGNPLVWDVDRGAGRDGDSDDARGWGGRHRCVVVRRLGDGQPSPRLRDERRRHGLDDKPARAARHRRLPDPAEFERRDRGHGEPYARRGRKSATPARRPGRYDRQPVQRHGHAYLGRRVLHFQRFRPGRHNRTTFAPGRPGERQHRRRLATGRHEQQLR